MFAPLLRSEQFWVPNLHLVLSVFVANLSIHTLVLSSNNVIIPLCSLYIQSHDSIVLEQSIQLLEQLPTRIELPAAVWTTQHQLLTSSHPVGSHSQLSPYWTLLSQEVSLWNHRLRVVSATLSHLIAAVKGEAAMLEEDEDLYQALVAEKVPKAWQVGNMCLTQCLLQGIYT